MKEFFPILNYIICLYLCLCVSHSLSPLLIVTLLSVLVKEFNIIRLQESDCQMTSYLLIIPYYLGCIFKIWQLDLFTRFCEFYSTADSVMFSLGARDLSQIAKIRCGNTSYHTFWNDFLPYNMEINKALL